MKKKIISILLVFCMVGCLLTINVSAASVMNGKHGADFADGALAERLEVIFYSGISGCVSPSIPAVGGALNNSTIYTTTFSNMSGSKRDYQCAAYARAAYSYLFGYDMGESSYRVEFTDATGRSSLSYALFAQYGVRCGAYIRTTNSASGAFNGSVGHSMIILSYDSNGVTTLEGNYNGSGGIGILYYTWNQFNQGQLSGRGRYVCSFSQPTASIYASVTSTPAPCTTHTKGTFLFCELAHPHYNYFTCSVCGATFTDGTTSFVDYCTQCAASANQPSDNLPQYVSCDVRIECVNGQIVNLYNSPGDSTRVDYFSKGQSVRSTYSAKLSDGSIWYQVSAVDSSGTSRNYWLKYESGKMTVTNISQPTVCTTHTWDAGTVTTEPTLTSSGIKTYICTVCGATKTETISALTSISGEGAGGMSWTFTSDGMLQISSKGNTLPSGFFYSLYNRGMNVEDVKSIIIQDGITTISQQCLVALRNVTSIELPASVTNIETYAFSECTSLQSIYLPENVSVLGSITGSPFYHCTALTRIDVSEKNPWFCSVDGVVFSKNMDEIVLFPEGRGGSYVLPDSVTTIALDAFFNSSLTSLEIPRSVTKIYTDTYASRIRLDGTFRVYSGSYAESFAEKYSLNYEIIEECADGHTWNAGSVTTAPTAISTGVMTYTCTLCGETKTESIPMLAATSTNRFLDVVTGEFYTDAVAWAVDNGVTAGVDNSHFAPNDTCTRAQIVTFLWRAAGQPEPASMQNSFTDVGTGDYYYKSVLWAAENGITSGTDATHFSPLENCTRAQAVTFLWRAAGQPTAGTGNSFLDIPVLSFYHGAVNWAVSRGITSGVSSSSFAPDNICTRAQIVTFLYRYMKF